MGDSKIATAQAYTKLAQIYDAIYAEKDYKTEVKQMIRLIEQHKESPSKTLLDVGCGTGGHAAFLRNIYTTEGLDLSTEQIAIARERFPDVRFHVANMIDFQLQKQFDVIICLFSAIGYVQTVERMAKAIDTMAHHLAPGGVLIVEPWLRRDDYKVGHISSDFIEQPDLRIARMCVSEMRDNVSVMAMHYMVATPEGVDTFTDLHELGMFSHAAFEGAFTAAGLAVTHDEAGLIGRGLYIGVKEQDHWG